MNLKDLIAATAEKAGTTQKTVREVYDALVQVVHEEVAKEETEKLTLPHLVTIRRAQAAERQGRNPSTGEPLTIPAKTVIRVKAVKALKDLASA